MPYVLDNPYHEAHRCAMKAFAVVFVLLALGSVAVGADPAGYTLNAHVKAVGQRKVSDGETPITNTSTGQIVTMMPDYRRIAYMTVLIDARQYTVEGKHPLAIGDYKVRFIEKHHRRCIEFLVGNASASYLVTEEAEAP
ncbi:MAG: hypothetical protein WCC87_10205 [Candidatus Korobacteraceae bacterium]